MPFGWSPAINENCINECCLLCLWTVTSSESGSIILPSCADLFMIRKRSRVKWGLVSIWTNVIQNPYSLWIPPGGWLFSLSFEKEKNVSGIWRNFPILLPESEYPSLQYRQKVVTKEVFKTTPIAALANSIYPEPSICFPHANSRLTNYDRCPMDSQNNTCTIM